MSKNSIYDILTYKQFQIEIKEKLQDKLGEAYQVEINQILKNNSIELVAIIIKDEKNSISPNIYIEDYYDYYLDGIKTEDIAEFIIDSHFFYMKNCAEGIYIEDFKWENIKDGIFYRIINRDKNKKLLQDVPHLLYLDLAITFHYLVSEVPSGLSAVRITKSHMKEWGIKLKELRDAAIKNTPKLFPVSLRNMNEIILEMLNNDWANQETNYDIYDPASKWPDDLLVELILSTGKEDNPMYVLTNSNGINGASCMLYREILHEFANELDSNLYLLPSSIHEVIIVKDDGYISKEDLVDMVVGVNELEVDAEDYLSNQVYYYNRHKDMIIL